MSDDKAADAMNAASAQLREALHASYGAPEFPADLYARCGLIVELSHMLEQAATMLHDTTERAPTIFEDLGSDDDTAAREHVDAACSALVRAAAALDDAGRLADEAHSALSHLKILD